MRKGRVTLIDPRTGFFVSGFKKKKKRKGNLKSNQLNRIWSLIQEYVLFSFSSGSLLIEARLSFPSRQPILEKLLG